MKTKKTSLYINISASIVAFMVQIIINFFLSPYIIEKLGEESYGFISLASNFVSYASLISSAVNAMAQRHISISYNRGDFNEANCFYKSIYAINVVCSIIIMLGSTFLIVNLQKFLNVSDGIVNEVRITFFLTFFNFIVSLFSSIYGVSTFCTNRMELNSIRQIVANVVRAVLSVILYLVLVPKEYYLVIAALVSGILVLILNINLMNKLTPELKLRNGVIDIKKIWILIKSGVWMFVSQLSNLLLTGLDLLITNVYVDAKSMGRLSIAKQIPNSLGILLGCFSSIFQATFTQYVAHDDKEGLTKEMTFTLRMLGVMMTVPFAGIIVFGIPFMELWLHSKNLPIFQIYCLMLLELVNIIANAYMYSVHSLFVAYDKVKYYSIFIFVGSIISVVGTILIVSFTNLGIYAVAGTSTVVLAVINGFLVPVYAAKVLNLKWNTILKVIGKAYVVLAITIIFFIPFRNFFVLDSWIKFFSVVMVVGIMGYILTFFLFLKKEERIKALKMIKRKR